jgi:hypothetical protein
MQAMMFDLSKIESYIFALRLFLELKSFHLMDIYISHIWTLLVC